MFAEILTVIAPVGILAAIGFVWDRKGLPFDTNMVAYLVTNLGAPCLVVSTLLANRPDPDVIASMGLAALLVVVVVTLVAGIGLSLSGQPIKVYLPALTFPNSGNIGIPLCLFAFGDEGLTLSVSFFAVMALTQFTLGISIAAGRISARAVFGNPVLWAALISVALLLAEVELPRLISGSVDTLAGMVIPLMLMSLGISLSRLKPNALMRSTVYSVLRLVLGLGAGICVAWMLDLEGVARAAVIIQAAMPTAVFNYLFAVRYDNQPSEVAGIVVVSTILSFLTLPLLLVFVLSGPGL
ncbi:MAG: AEC family transporter [Alphaproteobacteria bacterium]|nr:AEC family transporter [Alphaproteobacteria bacterium]